MSRKLIIIFLCLSQIAIAQNTVGTILKKQGVYEGYTLMAPMGSTKTYLINNCGQIVNQWTSDYKPGVSVYLLENGNLLRTGATPDATIVVGAPGGQIELYNWEGSLIWSYSYNSSQYSQHHDIYPLPNGNILMLAVNTMTNSEAIQAGRDPLNLMGDLYNEQIIELEPVGTNQANIVWEWNIKNHLIQDFDVNKDNYGVIKDHPELLNINYGVKGGGPANWLHCNSINYNPTLDQIIMSFKNMNEIYIIDHSTTTAESASHTGGTYGKGGDFLFRWGNPAAYNNGTSDNQKLFGQHNAHWIANGLVDEGKIMVFNNGDIRDFSSLEIINPLMSSPGFYSYDAIEGFLPSTSEWVYTDPIDPTNFQSKILSSGQRLPNGNTLICQGASGHTIEIDSDKNIVWEYINPENAVGVVNQGDAPPLLNYVFRAYKFGLDFPAFVGKDLTPTDPIEINVDNSQVCDFESPTVVSLSPALEAQNIDVITKNLELTFDEPVLFAGGEITLRKTVDNSIVESITDVNKININNNVLSISLSVNLESEVTYYVEIPNGTITDKRGNAFSGYADSNGWNFTTDVILSASSERTMDKLINIYPNPNSGEFYINFNDEIEKVKIKVTDLNGRLILESDSYEDNNAKLVIPTSNGTGIYIVSVESNGNVSNSKIIVRK